MAYLQAENRWREGYGMSLGTALRTCSGSCCETIPYSTPSIVGSAVPSHDHRRGGTAFYATEHHAARQSRFHRAHHGTEEAGGLDDSEQARSTVPVIVISGLPGVGKTELAVHAAIGSVTLSARSCT